MERRKERRVKRRLTCEFFHGATSHRGIILDLGSTGAFIRTNAVLSPGTEIDIHLAASVAAPAMTLRACVVRRRSVPATLTTLLQPGLGVQIIEAPREFGLLLSDSELDEAIQTDFDFARTAYTDSNRQDGPSHAVAEGTAGGGGRDRSQQPPPRTNAAPATGAGVEASSDAKSRRAKSPRSGAAGGEANAKRSAGPTAKRGEKAAAKRAERRAAARAAGPALAVLVGDSDLDEIAAMLGELDVETIRCGPYDPQLAALDDARLLVVSGEIAMSDPIPVDTDLLVGVAVCGNISETMRSQVRQQGFRYLLRPHVHPEALRVLLRYAIYAERDRRGRVRYPVGCEVSWKTSWKRNRGRLLDISRAGCGLLVEHSPDVGERITIKVSAETVGGTALKLRGRVIRSTPNAAHSGNERTALGIVLDELTPAAKKVLIDLCERWSESPPTLPRGERVATPSDEAREEKSPPPEPRGVAVEARAEGRATAASGDPTPTDLQDSAEAGAKRSTCRGVFEREVVQIDEEAHAVQALLGRDLSVAGLRVAQQPGIAPGDQLRIALYDTSQHEPLILNAEVSRDDGGSGLFLRFVDVPQEMTDRVEEIVAQLPAVEAIDPHGDTQVVPARVVSGSG